MEIRRLLDVSGCPIQRLIPLTYLIYSDNANGRIFPFNGVGGAQNTIQSCIASCAQNNYTLAGTEFAGKLLLSHIVPQRSDLRHRGMLYVLTIAKVNNISYFD
jgi:hypothetical protein